MKSIFIIGALPLTEACTTIVVGKDANTWGAPMVTTTNDCVQCEARVGYVPARDHEEGSKRLVYNGEWRSYPRMISNYSNIYSDIDTSELSDYIKEQASPIGSIPEIPHTNALWDGNYGMINEHGLALGESTCAGYLTSTSIKKGGKNLFSIRSLMNLALERCADARCAIQTMGHLGQKYGFYSEDGPDEGGAGEAVTMADPSGEAWVFHIMTGLNQSGAVWCAQRVPHDHVAVVANDFTIGKIDFNDHDHKNFYWSDNLLETARKADLPVPFTGKDDEFEWTKYFAPDKRFLQKDPSAVPLPMYGKLREWIVYHHTNPELVDKMYTVPIPPHAQFGFSQPKSGKKFTLEDVMNLKREVYYNTPYDMTKGVQAGPYGSPNRVEGGPVFDHYGQFARSISIQRTTYGVVHVATPDIEKGLPTAATWFAADQPLTSVFVPFHAASLKAEKNRYAEHRYGAGNHREFDLQNGVKTAWWAFDFVSNHMNQNFQNMSQQYVYPLRDELQAQLIEHAQHLHKEMRADKANAHQKAADFDSKHQEDVVNKWWDLAGMLVVRYNDGFFNYADAEQPANSNIGYPQFWQDMIG